MRKKSTTRPRPGNPPETSEIPVFVAAPEVARRWYEQWHDAADEVRNPEERAAFTDLLDAAKKSIDSDDPIDTSLLLRAVNSTAKDPRSLAIHLLHDLLKTQPNAADTLNWFFANTNANGRAMIARGLSGDHPAIAHADLIEFFGKALRDRSAWVRECAAVALGYRRIEDGLPLLTQLRSDTKSTDEQEMLDQMIAYIKRGYHVIPPEDPNDDRYTIMYVQEFSSGQIGRPTFWVSSRRFRKYGAEFLVRVNRLRYDREHEWRDED
tara:strand:- start:226 stop:1023 length:798 start_codon:yes stop_codon:yes gene_type:complete